MLVFDKLQLENVTKAKNIFTIVETDYTMEGVCLKEYKYTLKTITRLYSHGSNKNVPEFRVSELKALLRFTYRSIQLTDDIKKLLEMEHDLFGKAAEKENSKASPIRFRMISDKVITDKQKLLLHDEVRNKHNYKESNNMKTMISTNNSFAVWLRTLDDSLSLEYYQKLFELAFALYGMGGRARRARGSFSFSGEYISFGSQEDFLRSLLSVLNDVANKDSQFVREENTIIHSKTSCVVYPYIEYIKIGRRYNSEQALLKTVDRASHYQDCYYTGYVGMNKNEKLKRYASPVYVSAILLEDGLHPIITSLKADEELIRKKKEDGIAVKAKDKRVEFINEIL